MSAGHTHRLYVPGDSVVHRLAPEAKIVAAFAFVLAVAITPRRVMWVFGVHALLVGVWIVAARLPLRRVLGRLTVIAPFVTFAFFLPFLAGGPTTDVAGLSLSTEGLWGTWNVLTKAVLGASTSIVLASTTSVADIVRGLERLRVPSLITSVISFMFRYLDLITAEFGRMRTAMVARGHDPRWLWQAKPIASSAGAMFVRSYERGERVHAAMLARGFTGTMPVLDDRRATADDWRKAIVVPVLAATAALAGVLL